jgi:hypothetical protein
VTGPVGARPAAGSAPAGFQYVVLRCVPRADREEFVNLGVVLYCQATEFLRAGSRLHARRLLALDPDLDLAEVAQSVAAVAAVCDGDATAGAAGRAGLGQRFGWLSAPRSTVVRPGPVHGGLTADPGTELSRLLDRLVG